MYFEKNALVGVYRQLFLQSTFSLSTKALMVGFSLIDGADYVQAHILAVTENKVRGYVVKNETHVTSVTAKDY